VSSPNLCSAACTTNIGSSPWPHDLTSEHVDRFCGPQPIRTTQYVPLMAEGKDLEQQVTTRRQGEPGRNDHPDDVTHRA
jgi:hypothetical protein